MKKLTVLLTFIVLHFNSKSQFYQQYFDGADTDPNNSLIIKIDPSVNNVWQIGPPQKILFSSANTLPKAIVTDTLNNYPVNNISQFSFLINTSSFPQWFPIAIQWTQKLDFDLGLDAGIVEFSSDSITWENAHSSPLVYQFYGYNPGNKAVVSGEEAFTGTDNTWRDIWLCLSPAINQVNDTVYFRFTLKSDAIEGNKEGWMIDNMFGHMTIIHPVKEISQIDNVVLYPNISTGMVNIEMKKTKDTDMIDDIEMIDESGKVVERFGKNNTKVVLDIKKHKPGLYYFRVTTNGKPKLFKVIYEKN